MRHARLAAAALVAALALSAPASAGPPAPGPRDRCPVCGMFVAKHPDWLATAEFQDGGRFFFDGAKDLLKYLLDPAAHGSTRTLAQLRAATVIDYYAARPVDARAAFYVVGSDVYGPMGRELVPFEKREDADEFLRDHHGKRVLRFDEVTVALLRELG